MSTRMVCCVTGSQSLILLLLSGFLKGKFVSLFSHAFALLGTYTFFRNFVFNFIYSFSGFGNDFTCMNVRTA